MSHFQKMHSAANERDRIGRGQGWHGYVHETALKAAPGSSGGQGIGSWRGRLPHVCSWQGRA